VCIFAWRKAATLQKLYFFAFFVWFKKFSLDFLPTNSHCFPAGSLFFLSPLHGKEACCDKRYSVWLSFFMLISLIVLGLNV